MPHFYFLFYFSLLYFFEGELIGIEYLYNQTGQALQELVSDLDYKEADSCDDNDEGDDDEGFQVCTFLSILFYLEIFCLTVQHCVNLFIHPIHV